ncbi:MAG: hypothetical protein AAF583_00185 [Pseudomonadota bacterium]
MSPRIAILSLVVLSGFQKDDKFLDMVKRFREYDRDQRSKSPAQINGPRRPSEDQFAKVEATAMELSTEDAISKLNAPDMLAELRSAMATTDPDSGIASDLRALTLDDILACLGEEDLRSISSVTCLTEREILTRLRDHLLPFLETLIELEAEAA